MNTQTQTQWIQLGRKNTRITTNDCFKLNGHHSFFFRTKYKFWIDCKSHFFFGLQSIFAAAAAVHVYVSGSLNSDNVAICMFDGMTRQHYINESYHEMNDGFFFLRFFFVWFIQSSNSSINDFIAVSYENREKKSKDDCP